MHHGVLGGTCCPVFYTHHHLRFGDLLVPTEVAELVSYDLALAPYLAQLVVEVVPYGDRSPAGAVPSRT